jgi:hypothetical protein
LVVDRSSGGGAFVVARLWWRVQVVADRAGWSRLASRCDLWLRFGWLLSSAGIQWDAFSLFGLVALGLFLLAARWFWRSLLLAPTLCDFLRLAPCSFLLAW